MPSDLDPLANVGGSAPKAESPSASKAPVSERAERRRSARFQQVEFNGTAGEYFGLWFSTWFMTIFSGGTYGPWAKVRLKAYILNNTYIGGFGIGYHATGGQILRGRIIAFIISVTLLFTAQYYPPSLFGIVPLTILIAPLAMNSALRFRAKNMSWRNIRFHWNGNYGGTMMMLYIAPFISIISAGILYPVMTRMYYNYYADNHSLGTTDFDAELEVGACYFAFLVSLVGGLIAAGVVYGIIHFGAPLFTLNGQEVKTSTLIVYPYAAGMFIFQTSYMALCRNYMVQTLRLGRFARFESNISPIGYMKVKLSNAIMQLLSLGILTPYTVVREYEYLISCTEYKLIGDMDEFVDRERYKQGAFGDEFSEFEGLEMSV